MEQNALFVKLKEEILRLQKLKEKPLRVAINGVEGAGKTTFAASFCTFLQRDGVGAIHVSIDGFHYNKAYRYQQGRNSAKGYYEDSYQEEAFVEKVLLASQKEFPSYIKAVHDLKTDEYLDLAPIHINNDSVLITDGAYLFKPAYIQHWDLKIYLEVDFDTARGRGVQRDCLHLGGIIEAEEKFKKRYHAASKLYIESCQPQTKADWLIDVSNFEDYTILNRGNKNGSLGSYR